MYANTAKIIFNIRGKRETFFFKNRVLQFPAHPHQQNNQKKKTVDKKNKTKTKKTKKTETVRMDTAVHMEHDHLLKSPHLIKKDDPGVLTIQCSINRSSFNKDVCDTGLGVNIMSKVTYEYLYGTMPLEPTYAQLQMADQTFCFVEGIVKDVPIQIDDHYVPTDFVVVDMGEDYDPPIILGRPFLNTTKAIIYIRTGEIHFHFPSEKVCHYFNDNYIISEEPKKNKSKRRQRTHC
jgi:hypothetical protein